MFVHGKNVTSTRDNYSFSDGYTCQIFLIMIKVFQMLQKAIKTHAMPLGNHVTQQKLTETTENRLALTKTPNFGIFRFIPVYSALFWCHSAPFRCHSGSFQYIPVPFLFILSHSGVIPRHSGTFRFIPVYSMPFHSVPVFSNPHSYLFSIKACAELSLNTE